MPLYQVYLEKESFDLGIGYKGLDIPHGLNEAESLGRKTALTAKIRPDAASKAGRLSNVEDLPGAVLQEISARPGRQGVELFVYGFDS